MSAVNSEGVVRARESTSQRTSQMKQVGLVILMATLGGCIHWRPKAPVAPPEVAAGIQFPEWTKETTTSVEGPQLKALQIALEDFMPPGTKPPRKGVAAVLITQPVVPERAGERG